MSTPAQKKIVIIAGPNGAGKTTFAREFLPFEAECPVFINADLIAAGLSPFQPETVAFRAGRVMLQVEGGKQMTDVMVSKLPDADMQAVPRALLRAAQRARDVARQTDTPLVLMRDGVLVEELITGASVTPGTAAQSATALPSSP